MYVDHIVYAVPSLKKWNEEFAFVTGVIPQSGGCHPHFGTKNSLVAIGPQTYIEFISYDLSQKSDFEILGPRGFKESFFYGWCVGVTDTKGLLSKFKVKYKLTPFERGERISAKGEKVIYQCSESKHYKNDRSFPFFINWKSDHPCSNLDRVLSSESLTIFGNNNDSLVELTQSLNHNIDIINKNTSSFSLKFQDSYQSKFILDTNGIKKL